MVDAEGIKKEYEEIVQKLSDPELVSDLKTAEKLSQRKSWLEKIIEKLDELKDIKNKIGEDKAITESSEDPELTSLAETELPVLNRRQKDLETEIEALSAESGKEEKSAIGDKYGAIIVEIRAGTGGEEASLFAANLYKMYSRYAALKGWRQKMLDSSPTELGGFKEIIFEIAGNRVFAKMQYEGGVHRVQRIPETEKGGRIHTSTATVAILPRPKKAEIKINPQHLKLEFYRSSGPGGQYVNKRETAVRIIHVPTGLVVTSQTERNQLSNKENALAILEARLLEREQEMEEEKMGSKRKSQIGRAKRAEKIRTYNFPQDRTTDHRIKKSWKKIKDVMEGNLDAIISDLEEKLTVE